MRVLTLDDCHARQRYFRWWFQGHDHTEVYTAKEALDRLGEGQWDLVMLDHDLAEEHYLALSEGLNEGPVHKPDCRRHPCDCGASDYKKLAGTGMDVVDHIVSMPRERWPKLVIVHSMNPVRSLEMVRRLADAGVVVMKRVFDVHNPVVIKEQ